MQPPKPSGLETNGCVAFNLGLCSNKFKKLQKSVSIYTHLDNHSTTLTFCLSHDQSCKTSWNDGMTMCLDYCQTNTCKRFHQCCLSLPLHYRRQSCWWLLPFPKVLPQNHTVHYNITNLQVSVSFKKFSIFSHLFLCVI